MKKIIKVLVLVLTLGILFGCNKATTSNIEGKWLIVDETNQLKLIPGVTTDKFDYYFNFEKGNKFRVEVKAKDAVEDAKVKEYNDYFNSAGATYTIKGDKGIEIKYPELDPVDYTFTISSDNNHMTIQTADGQMHLERQ